jgi:hypothetical protein
MGPSLFLPLWLYFYRSGFRQKRSCDLDPIQFEIYDSAAEKGTFDRACIKPSAMSSTSGGTQKIRKRGSNAGPRSETTGTNATGRISQISRNQYFQISAEAE